MTARSLAVGQSGLRSAILYRRAIAAADSIPLSLTQLASRLALAKLFWDSAQAKLASWPATVQLFALEYRVPLLAPETAALLGTAVEYFGAIALLLGVLTRPAALALLGLVAVIQLFVYPQLWGQHLFWAACLILLVSRGAGKLSLDQAIRRMFS